MRNIRNYYGVNTCPTNSYVNTFYLMESGLTNKILLFGFSQNKKNLYYLLLALGIQHPAIF